jgi:hypothetical protein
MWHCQSFELTRSLGLSRRNVDMMGEHQCITIEIIISFKILQRFIMPAQNCSALPLGTLCDSHCVIMTQIEVFANNDQTNRG